MKSRLSHQLDAYTKQSGDARYSIRHLEKFSFIVVTGLVVISAFVLKTSLLAIPALFWWAHRRGVFT